MDTYLKLVTDLLLSSFEKFKLAQILRIENIYTDALIKLASSKDYELLIVVPIKHLVDPSILAAKKVVWVEVTLL